jgi:hypothetical protein
MKQTLYCQAEDCYSGIIIPKIIIIREKLTKSLWFNLKMYYAPKNIRKILKFIFLPVGDYLDKAGWKYCGFQYRPLRLFCKHHTQHFLKK